MNRGDRREAISRDDPDRRRFLETLVEACTKAGWQVHAYCLMNPVRAKLLPAEAPLKSYVWSSFPECLKHPTRRPAWLRVDRLLGEHGIPKDSPTGRQRFERRMEERRRAEDPVEAWARLARRLRRETPMTVAWMARRVQMGTREHAGDHAAIG